MLYSKVASLAVQIEVASVPGRFFFAREPWEGRDQLRPNFLLKSDVTFLLYAHLVG